MSSVYTPNAANNPASITIPSDGDEIDAASVNPAFEGLADKIAHTQANYALQTTANDLAVRPPGCRLATSHADAYSRAPISDLSSITAVGLNSYDDDRISIWDGSKWVVRTIEPLSTNQLLLSGLTTDKNYDVFAYWTGTAVRLELSAAWTNDTTRADALAWNRAQANWKGLVTKDADPTRLYVGTIRATSATTTIDTKAKRFFWSMYHRVRRDMLRRESASTWTMASAGSAWRQANNNAANQVEYVAGFGDAHVRADVRAMAGAAASSVEAYVGIGIDSTTANSAHIHGGVVTPASVGAFLLGATYDGKPGAGYHKLVWLEVSDNGTSTFYGTAGNGNFRAGIVGSIDG